MARSFLRSIGLGSLFAFAHPGLLIESTASAQQLAARYSGPIIDVHVHAMAWDVFGNPPPPNPVTGVVPQARTNRQALEATLFELRRFRVVKAVLSGPLDLAERWQSADSTRFLVGPLGDPVTGLPDTASLRAAILGGRVTVLGELTLQYAGLLPSDPRMEPYYALAEEVDIPVAIHTGIAKPGTPYGSNPNFRAALGDPLLLEDVLVRHPRLRVYLMHAGVPFLEETLALLWVYPQVYVDVAVHNWVRPRADFHTYLNALMNAGLGKRIMFGSDSQAWPDAVRLAIEGVDTAPFLTLEEKRDIFCLNAARFFRLETALCD